MFESKKAILFDFDGTIADTFSLHEQAFSTALRDFDLEFRYEDYAGMSTNNAIQRIFAANGKTVTDLDLAALTSRKRKLANELYRRQVNFIPGAQAFIRQAHAAGMQLFVGSSGSRMNVGTGLETLGIASLFTGVATADDVTNAKPHPEIFLSLLQRHQLEASEALVIEDAVAGVRSAVAAGIDVVCINDGVVPEPGYTVQFLHADFFKLSNLLSAAYAGK